MAPMTPAAAAITMPLTTIVASVADAGTLATWLIFHLAIVPGNRAVKYPDEDERSCNHKKQQAIVVHHRGFRASLLQVDAYPAC
jgi:hypothetical protein